MSALTEFQKLLATAEPPDLGPGPRPGVESESTLQRRLDGLLTQATLPKQNAELIRALTLLWHDHLDASHVIAQNIESADGAFVHGIMHRREPDYMNAKYWFRRVGSHPAFPEIANLVNDLLGPRDNYGLKKCLLPRGEWDAFSFVDACEQANRRSGAEVNRALREIQAIESAVLLERFCGPV
jgi:hypothetical protein